MALVSDDEASTPTPDTGPTPAPVEITATLCGWRVVGIPRDWSDRNGGSWSTTAQVAPSDMLTIWLGDIPEHVVRGVREFHAHGLMMLQSLTGHLAEKSPSEIDQLLQELVDGADDVEKALRGRYPVWLTLEIARPVTLQADPEAKARYFRGDTTALLQELDNFAEYSADQLDLAFSTLLPTLSEKLPIGGVLSRRRRAYVVAPGRMTWGMPDFQGSAFGYASTDGWVKLPFAAMADAMDQLPRSDEKPARMTRSAARWLTAALAEDKDKLRRFQFAFFGLEILANKVGKDVEEAVVADLSAEIGVPVTHLIWPSPKESDSPWRNLTFRFAMMAFRVHRHTAGEDIERFNALARQRNGLAHGQAADEDIENLQDNEAISLLERYLAGAVQNYQS
jgi:hypothetical protein